MTALIGLALTIIGTVTIVLCMITIRGRRQRRRARRAGPPPSRVPVDEQAWAELVRQLKKSRAWDEH